MSTELQELVEFLHHNDRNLQLVALDTLVGYSQGPQTFVFKANNYEPIRDLQKLSQDPIFRPVGHALKILINLCDDPKVLDMLATDEFFVYYVANSITDLNNTNADLFCILLVNLAKNDAITQLLDKQRTVPKKSTGQPQGEDGKPEQIAMVGDDQAFKSKKLLDCLMDCFVKGSDRSLNTHATFDYLAYFFADLSRFKAGREYFVKEQEYDHVVPITKLLVFTDYESKIRRAGVASTIKNSLFDIDSHEKFVFDANIDLVVYLLRPLMDGKDEIPEDEMFDLPDELQLMPPEKKRDSDVNIMATHVESILLLCTTRQVRDYFREKSIYSVIRELHKNVEEEVIREPCERLVNMIMRDESEEKVQELDEDEDEKIVEVV